jgi:hypothetical protein
VGVDTIHGGFFSQETAPGSAALHVNFRSKKRANGHEVRAPFSAKLGLKKRPSEADYAFVN